MKKSILVVGILLAGISLSGCGSSQKQNSDNSSLKAENSSLKAKVNSSKKKKATQQNVSNEDYAMMAYLKLQSEDSSPAEAVQNLQSSHANMHWRQIGAKYVIDFGAHSTAMKVNSNDVAVTYDDVEGDHMGSGNGHRTFTKAELLREFGKYKATIEGILRGNNASISNHEQTSQQNQSSRDPQLNANGEYGDPDVDPRLLHHDEDNDYEANISSAATATTEPSSNGTGVMSSNSGGSGSSQVSQ